MTRRPPRSPPFPYTTLFRSSRDQAHAGAEVTPEADALRPGDILLFSARPGAGVTHVGLYVGELKFIHRSEEHTSEQSNLVCRLLLEKKKHARRSISSASMPT